MDIEVNKFAGAIFGTLMFVVGVNILSEGLFAPRRPAVPGYDLPAAEEAAAPGGAPGSGRGAPPGAPRQGGCGPRPDRRQEVRLLPHLREGRRQQGRAEPLRRRRTRKGRHRGFNYSAALKGKGGTWTFEEIEQFITNPRGAVPGTTMAFAGIAQAQERADILGYLRSLSDNPQPLPAAP